MTLLGLVETVATAFLTTGICYIAFSTLFQKKIFFDAFLLPSCYCSADLVVRITSTGSACGSLVDEL